MASILPGQFLALSIAIFACLLNNCVGGEVHSEMVSVKPTKLWRFLGENEQEVSQRYSENIDEFSVGRIKCLRYCIQSKLSDEDLHFLHVTWKLEMENKSATQMGSTVIADKGFRPEIIQGKSIKSDDSGNAKNQCTFSIVTGCEIPQVVADTLNEVETNYIKSLQINLDVLEGDSAALNFINEKLIDESKPMNESETSFYVKENQAEVNAIILGDVSRVDLKIPIGASSGATARTPRLTLATSSRMPGAEPGVRLSVLSPPPGGWRLAVRGADAATPRAYRLIVTSAVVPEFSRPRDHPPPTLDYFADGGKISVFEDASNDEFVHNHSGIIPRQIKVLEEKIDQVSNDSNADREISARMISVNHSPDVQVEQTPFKFPPMKNDVEIMNLNANLTIEDRMLDREYSEADDLSRSRSLNDELPIKKPLIVDVNPNSNLIALPGTIHRLTFDITNNHILTIRHYFTIRSSLFKVFPPYGNVEIAPGQTFGLVVEMRIPPNIGETATNTITLQVQGIENTEKTATLFVRPSGSRLNDDTKPTIYYYFNNNCALRTSAEKCLKNFWSVDITVQDAETGIKSVISAPKGVYPRSQYISGSTSPVYFYYSSNCCNRIVEVTATDVAGNVITKKIDVGEWYNLTEGEIAAVVIGTLFIILLIVLIIITILYCTNRRKSHDLPYSQRYGSRTAPGNQ